MLDLTFTHLPQSSAIPPAQLGRILHPRFLARTAAAEECQRASLLFSSEQVKLQILSEKLLIRSLPCASGESASRGGVVGRVSYSDTALNLVSLGYGKYGI